MQFTKKKIKVVPVSTYQWSLEKDGITQSFLNEWLACRQRAVLNYKEGWTSSQVSNALTFGSLFHTCLEQVYEYFSQGIKSKDIILENVISVTLDEHKKAVQEERNWGTEDEENQALNEGYIRILLPEYIKKYEKLDRTRKWTYIEKEFCVEVDGIKLRGKMDRVETNSNGETYIVDTKTKYSIDPTIQDRLSFDPQVMMYILAYESLEGKLPNGFILDCIQRPRLRKGGAETLDHFMKRVQSDVDESYFQRINMRFDRELYENWRREFAFMLHEIKLWNSRTLVTYRNPASCETRYGTCKFIGVCGLNNYAGLYQRKKPFMELNNA